MATAKKNDDSDVMKLSRKTGWKSMLDYEERQQGTKKRTTVINTTSRFRKTKAAKKKGGFQTKAAKAVGGCAPDLASVVNAKPEIKKKATAEAEAREKKREEKRKKIAGRIQVSKPSPKQLKGGWTNAINKQSVSIEKSRTFCAQNRSSKVVQGKSKSLGSLNLTNEKSSDSNFKVSNQADWQQAYQDILSPQSGKPKAVAKQDLVSQKVPSPKKKSRKPSPTKPDLPAFNPLDDFAEEPPANQDRVKPVRIEPKKDEVEPVQHEAVEDKVQLIPDNRGGAKVETKVEDKEKYVDDDEYEDYDSEGSPFEVESPNTKRRPDVIQETPKTIPKKQLLFEFALPSLDGEEDDDGEGLVVPVDIQSLDDLSSIGSWPSIESNDSYDTKMNKMMQRWVGVYDDYNDEYEEGTIYNNDVNLQNNVLDHIVLAAPDLEEAMVHFEDMCGIRPNPVGPLQGLGAKTAHIGLDNNRYIEIIAPDKENPGPIGDILKTLDPGTLTPWHYAIRSTEVSRLIEGYVYDVLGWEPDHIAMVQALPDTSIRQWDLLTMYGHDMGGCAPCYVKWKDHGQHPTATIALKASLESLRVRAPQFHDVHKLISGVDGIDVDFGEPLLECTIETPNGTVTFSADFPTGLVFPGYDEQISEIPELLPSDNGDWAEAVYVPN